MRPGVNVILMTPDGREIPASSIKEACQIAGVGNLNTFYYCYYKGRSYNGYWIKSRAHIGAPEGHSFSRTKTKATITRSKKEKADEEGCLSGYYSCELKVGICPICGKYVTSIQHINKELKGRKYITLPGGIIKVKK